MFYTYILQSEKDNSPYVGQTNNLEDRLLVIIKEEINILKLKCLGSCLFQ